MCQDASLEFDEPEVVQVGILLGHVDSALLLECESIVLEHHSE